MEKKRSPLRYLIGLFRPIGRFQFIIACNFSLNKYPSLVTSVSICIEQKNGVLKFYFKCSIIRNRIQENCYL